MNKKIFEKLESNVGKTLLEVECKNDKLTLTFKEKVLLLNKKKTYTFESKEDISGVCLKLVENSILKKVTYDGIRVSLLFEKESQPKYTISFKTSEILG